MLVMKGFVRMVERMGRRFCEGPGVSRGFKEKFSEGGEGR